MYLSIYVSMNPLRSSFCSARAGARCADLLIYTCIDIYLEIYIYTYTYIYIYIYFTIRAGARHADLRPLARRFTSRSAGLSIYLRFSIYIYIIYDPLLALFLRRCPACGSTAPRPTIHLAPHSPPSTWRGSTPRTWPPSSTRTGSPSARDTTARSRCTRS